MGRPKPNSETLALEALGFVAADEVELGRFLGLSGLSLDRLRAEASSRATLSAVLAYVLGHEPTARAFAETHGYAAEDLARAAHELGGA